MGNPEREKALTRAVRERLRADPSGWTKCVNASEGAAESGIRPCRARAHPRRRWRLRKCQARAHAQEGGQAPLFVRHAVVAVSMFGDDGMTDWGTRARAPMPVTPARSVRRPAIGPRRPLQTPRLPNPTRGSGRGLKSSPSWQALKRVRLASVQC